MNGAAGVGWVQEQRGADSAGLAGSGCQLRVQGDGSALHTDLLSWTLLAFASEGSEQSGPEESAHILSFFLPQQELFSQFSQTLITLALISPTTLAFDCC